MAATNTREYLRAKIAACLATVSGISFAERTPEGQGASIAATNVTYRASGAFRVGSEHYEPAGEANQRKVETGELVAAVYLDIAVERGASIDAAVDDAIQRVSYAVKGFSAFGQSYDDAECTVTVRRINRTDVAPAVAPDAGTASVVIILTTTFTIRWK